MARDEAVRAVVIGSGFGGAMAACCNPSFTIAAFAERCLDTIVAEDILTKGGQRQARSSFSADCRGDHDGRPTLMKEENQ